MHGKLLSDQRVACHKQNIISFRITSCSKHCRHHMTCLFAPFVESAIKHVLLADKSSVL